MSADHVDYLRQFGETVDVTVWTGTPALWRFLRPEVTTAATVSPEDLSHAFDVAVFETPRPATALADLVAKSGGVVVHFWPSRRDATVRLGGAATMSIPLAPPTNMPMRVREVYRALGCRTPEARLAAPALPTIFFNPYASTSAKSLTPAFASAVLAVLQERLCPALSIVVQCPQTYSTFEDASHLARLDAAMRGAEGAHVSVLRTPGLEAYLRQVSGALVVVGADTSSQHLAAAYGRASIAFYPSHVGLGYYLAWGPTATRCLHFVAPEERDRATQRRLADMAGDLAALLARRAVLAQAARSGLRSSPFDPRGSAAGAGRAGRPRGGLPVRGGAVGGIQARDGAARVLRETRSCLAGDANALRRLRRALATWRQSFPDSWRAHLFQEFEAIVRELPSLRQHGARAVPAHLERLNVFKVAALLHRASR